MVKDVKSSNEFYAEIKKKNLTVAKFSASWYELIIITYNSSILYFLFPLNIFLPFYVQGVALVLKLLPSLIN